MFSSRGNSNCFGFSIVAARISSSKPCAAFAAAAADSSVSSYRSSTSITSGLAASTAITVSLESLDTDSGVVLAQRLRIRRTSSIGFTSVLELVLVLVSTRSTQTTAGVAGRDSSTTMGVDDSDEGAERDDVDVDVDELSPELRPDGRRSRDIVFLGAAAVDADGLVMRQ